MTVLDALIEELRDHPAEILLVDSSTDGTNELVRSRFPTVRLLHFDEPHNLPELRGHGIAESHGDIVAILDAFSVVVPGWADAVLRAHKEQPQPVIGGTVDFYAEDPFDFRVWTIYVNEYAGFMPPLAPGCSTNVPGSNMSYKRSALGDVENLRRNGFWKTFLNKDLEKQAPSLWIAPDMVVRLFKPIPFWDFFQTRYDHGRCYAAMRTSGASAYTRGMRALLAPLLPGIFLWRLLATCWPKREYRTRLLLSLPLQAILFANWSWGEFWGYLLGCGRSCARLYY